MIENMVDWQKFMSNQDMIWNKIPHSWMEAPFLGNGFFGVTVYFSDDDKKLIIDTGHTKVFDNRNTDGFNSDTVIETPRLSIGKYAVSFEGKVTALNLRLDLYNAVLKGCITTDCGTSKIALSVLNDTDSFVFEHKEINEKLTFNYIPSHAMSPRKYVIVKKGEGNFENYPMPREYYFSDVDGQQIFIQPYFNKGGFSTCSNSKENLFVACFDYDNQNTDILAKKSATHIIDTINNLNELKQSHNEWWNNFYKKSFISFEGGKYESFLYIQLYKLACASRENGMPFDTCGPWLTDNTRWPGAWWNLNVELTVSPLYTSNHIEIAKCLSNSLKNGINELIDNVPEKFRKDCAAVGRNTTSSMYSPVTVPGDETKDTSFREAGNLTWALFYCWQEYKITDDKFLLEEVIYPLLKRSVQFYIYSLYEGKDKKLHLKSTVSPEYYKTDSDDVNYDLSLLTWGLMTLIEIAKSIDKNNEKINEWKNILEKLTDYPQSDDEGLFIARTTKYTESHRHFSHLLSFYPLHILKDEKLIRTSIDFWQSKPESLQGYSQTGAASMRAMLNDGNMALEHLDVLIDEFVLPNTMYEEGENPVLETPPSAVTSILEMFIQSYNDYIEVFPAVPNKWKYICFDKLLCYGGFEVGSQITDGKIQWIKIHSLLGKPCRIKTNGFEFPKNFIESNTDGIVTIKIKKGETLEFSNVDNPKIFAINNNDKNYYGLK